MKEAAPCDPIGQCYTKESREGPEEKLLLVSAGGRLRHRWGQGALLIPKKPPMNLRRSGCLPTRRPRRENCLQNQKSQPRERAQEQRELAGEFPHGQKPRRALEEPPANRELPAWPTCGPMLPLELWRRCSRWRQAVFHSRE